MNVTNRKQFHAGVVRVDIRNGVRGAIGNGVHTGLHKGVYRDVVQGSRGALLLMAAVVLIGLLPVAFTTSAQAQNADEMHVTNHLFAERVIQTADGGYIAQDVIVGFERGTHTFETLTQIVLPKGSHSVEMALRDPKGAELERIKFGTLQADKDGWTQSLRGTWRNIRFQSDGMHELIVYRAGKVVARFFLVVT